MGFLQRARRGERGAVAVEFAIVLPILAVILFGIIEFGITLVREEQWVSAARDAARYAAVNCQPEGGTAGCTSTLIQNRVAASMGCSTSSGADYCWPPPNSTLPAETIGGAPGTCSDTVNNVPANVGKLVTVSWNQEIHVISIPFFGQIDVHPLIKGAFRCEG